MKIIFPGGDVTTCVYPGGFWPSRFRNCFVSFFAGLAIAPPSKAAMKDPAIIAVVVVRIAGKHIMKVFRWRRIG
jgi:hypothetical protein